MDEFWTWPHWKFGLKRDDLFTSLHTEFNTVPFAIQDPDAFRLDVERIAATAGDLNEFRHMLGEQKTFRLKELNNALENASLEIIGNPDLIGTKQWQYAAQLFRNRSLDTLVQYFSSYLPESDPLYSVSDSSGNLIDNKSVDDYCPVLFDDTEDEQLWSSEPMTPISSSGHLPTRTMTMRSDASSVSTDVESTNSITFDCDTPARRSSFSESDSENHIDMANLKVATSRLFYENEATSQREEPHTPVMASVDDNDIEIMTSQAFDFCTFTDEPVSIDEPKLLTHSSSASTLCSDTPTPRAEKRISSGPVNPFDMQDSPIRQRSRSSSLSSSSLHHVHSCKLPVPNHDGTHLRPANTRARMRLCSPDDTRRRSPRRVAETAMRTTRMHNSMAGCSRSRHQLSRGRKRFA